MRSKILIFTVTSCRLTGFSFAALIFLVTVFQVVGCPAIAQTIQNGNGNSLHKTDVESDMFLKEQLLNDFGFDLPISGTFPDLFMRENPVIIHSSDPVEIINTMYLTVHGMNLGLSAALGEAGNTEMPNGILWKPVAENVIEFHPRDELYSFGFERKELREGKIDTQMIRFYFRVVGSHRYFTPTLERMELPSLSYGGIRLPVAVGALHHAPEKTVDYAKVQDRADLGFGFAYETLGIKGTIYIYPVPADFAVNEEVLKAAFEQSVSEVEAANKDIVSWPDAQGSLGFKERAWMVGQDAEKATALGMGIVQGHFLKYCLTWVRDQALDQAAVQFMTKLKFIVLNR